MQLVVSFFQKSQATVRLASAMDVASRSLNEWVIHHNKTILYFENPWLKFIRRRDSLIESAPEILSSLVNALSLLKIGQRTPFALVLM